MVEQVVTHQPALATFFYYIPFLSAGGRTSDVRQRMTREEAVEVARAFIATQPKDWRQEWPAKRLGVKRVLSRHTNEEVWQVRSLRLGLDRSNISVEVSPQTGAVSYAEMGGGLREQRQQYFPAKSPSDDDPPTA